MQSRCCSNPWIICFMIVLIVAVSDSSIMFLIDHYDIEFFHQHENVIEPMAMGLFALPLIFYFIVNPFLKREEKNKQQLLSQKQEKLVILSTQAEVLEKAILEATKDLSESEERYALVAEGINDGIWEWNLEKSKVYFSSRWKSVLGYDESFHIESMSWWYDQMKPDDKKIVQDHIALLSPSHRTFSVKYQMRNAKNISYGC